MMTPPMSSSYIVHRTQSVQRLRRTAQLLLPYPEQEEEKEEVILAPDNAYCAYDDAAVLVYV